MLPKTDGPTSSFNVITAATWLCSAAISGKEQQERFLRSHLQGDGIFLKPIIFGNALEKKKTRLREAVFNNIPIYMEKLETTENDAVPMSGAVWRCELIP